MQSLPLLCCSRSSRLNSLSSKIVSSSSLPHFWDEAVSRKLFVQMTRSAVCPQINPREPVLKHSMDVLAINFVDPKATVTAMGSTRAAAKPLPSNILLDDRYLVLEGTTVRLVLWVL